MTCTGLSRGNRRACPAGDSRSQERTRARTCRRCQLWVDRSSVQSFADFAPHVPAVGVLAVVLLRNDRPPWQWRRYGRRHTNRSVLSPKLRWAGPVVLSVFLLSHAVRDAWIENRLDRAGLPLPGTFMPTVAMLEAATGLLESREVARIGILTDMATPDMAARGLEQCRLALEDVLHADPTGPKVIFASVWLTWSCIDERPKNGSNLREPLATTSSACPNLSGCCGKSTINPNLRQPLPESRMFSPPSRCFAIWCRRRIAFSRPDAARPSWPSPTPNWLPSIICLNARRFDIDLCGACLEHVGKRRAVTDISGSDCRASR